MLSFILYAGLLGDFFKDFFDCLIVDIFELKLVVSSLKLLSNSENLYLSYFFKI